MSNLIEVVRRNIPPVPWAEGEKIPWNDPAFSARMLKEHLSQAHDAASRRAEIIDRHVDWIDRHLLQNKPATVLDLGCGPGFYAQRLSARGHTCTGVDFSPASIAYARQQSRATYIEGDIRRIDYGTGFDLVMFVYGEFNVFRPDDARLILRKAHAALKPGGMLLLEPHSYDFMRGMGDQASTWSSAESGLFTDQPHLMLEETFWDETQHVVTHRWYIVDAATGQVTRYADSMQAYTDEAYRQLLADCGFGPVTFYPSLSGEGDVQTELVALTAKKPD